jgi:hypothetical protein
VPASSTASASELILFVEEDAVSKVVADLAITQSAPAKQAIS